MTKFIFFLLPLLISCSSKVTEKKNPDLQYNLESINVKGKVKKITEFDYKQFVNDSLIDFYVTNTDFDFDVNGNIILEKIKLIGEGPRFEKNIYDNMGNKIEVLIKDPNHNNFTTQTKYTLNSNGQIISEKQLWYGSSNYSLVEFEYDEFGNKVSAINPLTGKESETHYENTYNQSNELIKSLEFIEGKTLRTVDEYKYSKKRIIEKKSNNLLANIIDLYKYKYDDNGKLISSVFESKGLQIKEERNKYDDFGNILEKVIFDKGKYNYRSSHFFIYQFDKMHNWIYKETYFLDSTLVRSISRKIEYY
jgi:hypothetical protein